MNSGAIYCTVIVPTIDGCIPQWYANVPRVDIVTGAADAPAVMLGVVNDCRAGLQSIAPP